MKVYAEDFKSLNRAYILNSRILLKFMALRHTSKNKIIVVNPCVSLGCQG
jgi:hypothetical protein